MPLKIVLIGAGGRGWRWLRKLVEREDLERRSTSLP